ncbi:feline leukemia virus subgroup C receptor-related protein 1-like protein [Dinothrombium tinctorium]|uniref:Feline leukemia virus subgroup C receptor-related protein 1-like protein n=1 Tax=Dinothrombium tinctorium TaxID=1965070 RepID=A0A3S3NU47_9ACAR|nr:feline leukemia virus subgroup C receptor-related protein 1-like protein [Dinothrombium tinctorium]
MGATLNAFSCIGKCFTINPQRFWLVLVCQLISSLSVPFIQSIPAHVARIWFPKEQVSRATSIGILAMFIGVSLGSILPSLIVPLNSNKIAIACGLSKLMIGEAIIATILFLLIVVWFEEKPKHPPSYSQLKADSMRASTSLSSSLKLILSNKCFVLLLIYFGLSGAVFNSLLILLNEIIFRFYKNAGQYPGISGLTIGISVVIGTYFYGFVLDKTKMYKKVIFIFGLLSILSLFSFEFVLSHQNMSLFVIASALLGFFSSAFGSVGFNFGAELTYPVSEGVTGGFLVLSAQTMSAVYSLICSFSLNHYGVTTTLIMSAIVISVALFAAIFIKSNLRRQEAENECLLAD